MTNVQCPKSGSPGGLLGRRSLVRGALGGGGAAWGRRPGRVQEEELRRAGGTRAFLAGPLTLRRTWQALCETAADGGPDAAHPDDEKIRHRSPSVRAATLAAWRRRAGRARR